MFFLCLFKTVLFIAKGYHPLARSVEMPDTNLKSGSHRLVKRDKIIALNHLAEQRPSGAGIQV